MNQNQRKTVARRIAQGMAELEHVMASGRSPRDVFTMRTVEIASPATYGARQVRATRNRLNVSQAVFAKLLGVSAELVEHWEQGVCLPRGIARRLLDEINHDPADFLSRHIKSAA